MADDGLPDPGEPGGNVADATITDDGPERRYGVPATSSRGQTVLHPSREDLVDLVRRLRDEEGFVMCVDVCGVDYLTYRADRALPPGVRPERFEVVVSLLGEDRRRRVRLRVQVPEDDPTCPTLFDVFPGTEAPERETYDLFGIRFVDHPDLTRILMPEDWRGHPLRKDYAIGQIPVQFKAAPGAR